MDNVEVDETDIIVRKIPGKQVPHSVVFDSGTCVLCRCAKAEIEPGIERTIPVPPQCLFRAESAETIEGVDYSAFVVTGTFVGIVSQYPPGERPAAELLQQLRRASDRAEGEVTREGCFKSCQIGLYLTLRVRNVSDRPQRFAIKLVGTAIL